jgi:hypothetical protein
VELVREHLAPGEPTHFEARPEKVSYEGQESTMFVLSKDDGNLDCSLDLTIQVKDASAQEFFAESIQHAPVVLQPVKRTGLDTLVLGLIGPRKEGVDGQIHWQSRDTINLTYKKGPAAVVKDWLIWPDKGRYDSLGRAHWREQLDRIVMGLCLLAVAAYIYSALSHWRNNRRKEAEKRMSLDEALILRVKGDSDQETGDMQAFLRRAFVEHDLDEALQQLPTNLRERHAILSKARERVAKLSGLANLSEMVEWARS